MYIYNTYKLCNKHFEKYYILPSNQLTRNAVPTLFLEYNTPVSNQISVLQTSAELGPATHNPEPATSMCLESGSLPSTRVSKQKKCVQECADIADFLLIFDKLFDSFNGRSLRKHF